MKKNTVDGYRSSYQRINGSQDVTLVSDAENHVTSITGSGINATYVYDGDGKRVKATVGGVTTVYIGNYYERDNGTTVRKYYYAGAVRVAMRSGGNTFYLLNDHLTSTAITTNSSGVRQTELRYFAYGGTRYDAGSQMTLYRYTGQRVETGTGLYDYGARWYDPQIGRFLAADSIVPTPGDSQALNRYMYVLGNPLKYSDPTGHAACAAGDRACWENEWYWKNRWYNAHGYFHDGNHWGRSDNAVFSDEGILREVLAEAGIAAAGSWDLGELSLVGQGVVALMNKVGGAGRLKALFDPPGLFQGSPSVTFRRGTAGWGTCTGMGACSLYNTVWFFDALFRHADDWIRATAVHELGHIIDHKHMARQASFISQSFPGYGDPQFRLTDYGRTNAFEYWAEAVTIWVYGNRYKGPGGVFAEQDRGFLSALQVNFLETWLGGR